MNDYSKATSPPVLLLSHRNLGWRPNPEHLCLAAKDNRHLTTYTPPAPMAAYDRDPIVEAMLALYETVLLMSNSPAKDLFIAPPSGWHFNEEQLAILQDTKSRTVIDLILHLPYLFGSVDNYAVAYQTTPINYYNSDWFSVRSASDPYGFGGMMAKYVEDSELPLTMQHENVGVILMLDTRSGKWLLLFSPER